MLVTPSELDQMCARLFDAFVAHDLDAVEAMLTNEVVITQNGNSMSWADARPMLEGVTNVVRNHRYENVRRVIGDDVVVEEHTVVAETPTGRPLSLPACVVVRVNDAGLITAIDEYIDVPDLT